MLVKLKRRIRECNAGKKKWVERDDWIRRTERSPRDYPFNQAAINESEDTT